jgi:hypothetical protein
MTRRLGFGLLLGFLLTTAAIDAQLGGLIGRSGGTMPKAPPQPGQQPSGSQMPASTLGCPVDDAAMDRLLKELEAQRAEREAALNDAAAAKTAAQYEACLQEVADSPEFDKIMASYDPAAPGKSDAAAKALSRAKCGPRPDEVRNQMENRYNAATKPLSACDARIVDSAIPFCKLPPAAQASAQKAGFRVPSEDGRTLWVYTPAEAATLAPRCAQLTSLLAAKEAQDKQFLAPRP